MAVGSNRLQHCVEPSDEQERIGAIDAVPCTSTPQGTTKLGGCKCHRFTAQYIVLLQPLSVHSAAVVVPVVFFPVSVTLWAMVDLLTRPVEPVELAEALTAAASTDRARTTPP